MKKLKSLFVLLIVCQQIQAQTKNRISLKDSLDGAFDLSDYIINAHGFVPIPVIITEPALGGFGGAIAPVFIKKRMPYKDSVEGKEVIVPVSPDITGAVAAYTANNSWVLGAFRSGSIRKYQLKYVLGGGYANINMAFYRALPFLGDQKFEFNIKTVPLFMQLTKRIGITRWYAGLKYLFLRTNVKYDGSLPSFVKQRELSSVVSQLGVVIERDTRNTIFTPDKGLKLHFDAIRSDTWLGSDYEFWRLDYYGYGYKPISKKIVVGLRLDGQQSFGNPPFYLLPYIDMRGIPIEKYQGNADVLTELETRYDFTLRWSAVLFGGAGKAFNEWTDFGSSPYIFSYGAGFRYLVARKFGLRMGVDVAHGPGTWAYYIVFGSNWLK
jgi:Omp85 superfamily domain